MSAEPTHQQPTNQALNQVSQQSAHAEVSLKDFGVETEHLHRAARDGVQAALNTTPYHPVTARGFQGHRMESADPRG